MEIGTGVRGYGQPGGGRSRSRVSAIWPTRLLFTVYFTYTSKEQTYFKKHVASLVSLLLSTQLDKGYQKMDPSPVSR